MLVQKNPGKKWGFPQGMKVTPEAHLPSEYQILPPPRKPNQPPLSAEDCSVHLCTGCPPSPPHGGVNGREKRSGGRLLGCPEAPCRGRVGRGRPGSAGRPLESIWRQGWGEQLGPAPSSSTKRSQEELRA